MLTPPTSLCILVWLVSEARDVHFLPAAYSEHNINLDNSRGLPPGLPSLSQIPNTRSKLFNPQKIRLLAYEESYRSSGPACGASGPA
jgi:hypothetical protein